MKHVKFKTITHDRHTDKIRTWKSMTFNIETTIDITYLIKFYRSIALNTVKTVCSGPAFESKKQSLYRSALTQLHPNVGHGLKTSLHFYKNPKESIDSNNYVVEYRLMTDLIEPLLKNTPTIQMNVTMINLC